MELVKLEQGELPGNTTVKCPLCSNYAKIADIPEDTAPGLAEWLRCPRCGAGLRVVLGFSVVSIGI